MSATYTYPAAKHSKAIRIISLTVVIFTFGLAVFAVLLDSAFWVATVILTLIILGCWLKEPMAYDWAGDDLVVHFRWGSKQRGPIDSCHRLDKPLTGALRLFGNGGIFAMTGIYWTKGLGRFHAYLSTHYPEHILVVDRHGVRTLVSPANSDAFMAAAPEGPAQASSEPQSSSPSE